MRLSLLHPTILIPFALNLVNSGSYCQTFLIIIPKAAHREVCTYSVASPAAMQRRVP